MLNAKGYIDEWLDIVNALSVANIDKPESYIIATAIMAETAKDRRMKQISDERMNRHKEPNFNRQDPQNDLATEPQKKLMDKLKVPYSETTTKAEASQRIDAKING